MTDAINPSHYRWLPGGLEVIDITEGMSFCHGNVVKYVLRADHKGRPLEDLRKAAWYLEREIARREAEAVPEWTATPGSIFEVPTSGLGRFDAAPLAEQIAALAEAYQIPPAEAAQRIAKALDDGVVEPLAKTGPLPPHQDFDEPCPHGAAYDGVLTHTRTAIEQGPDFCDECSSAISEWVGWPCPRAALEPFDTPDHARYDDQHVRGEE